MSNVHHNKAGLSEQPDWYRITDDLEFALDIHEYSGGSWKPYRCAPQGPSPLRANWPQAHLLNSCSTRHIMSMWPTCSGQRVLAMRTSS